jgi:small-conductance mechanosensitive channel
VKLVQETLLAVAEAHPEVLEEPATDVRLDAFSESSLDFALLCWIPDAPNDDEVASDLRFAILEAFRERGIVIPVPQRDLRIHAAPQDRPAEGKSTALAPAPFA